MLSEITAEQYWEWMAHNELRPFTQGHSDRVIALLAEVIGKAFGVRVRGGDLITTDHFLDILHGVPLKTPPQQSVEHMTMLLNTWIDGSNALLREQANLPESLRGNA